MKMSDLWLNLNAAQQRALPDTRHGHASTQELGALLEQLEPQALAGAAPVLNGPLPNLGVVLSLTVGLVLQMIAQLQAMYDITRVHYATFETFKKERIDRARDSQTFMAFLFQEQGTMHLGAAPTTATLTALLARARAPPIGAFPHHGSIKACESRPTGRRFTLECRIESRLAKFTEGVDDQDLWSVAFAAQPGITHLGYDRRGALGNYKRITNIYRALVKKCERAWYNMIALNLNSEKKVKWVNKATMGNLRKHFELVAQGVDVTRKAIRVAIRSLNHVLVCEVFYQLYASQNFLQWATQLAINSNSGMLLRNKARLVLIELHGLIPLIRGDHPGVNLIFDARVPEKTIRHPLPLAYNEAAVVQKIMLQVLRVERPPETPAVEEED